MNTNLSMLKWKVRGIVVVVKAAVLTGLLNWRPLIAQYTLNDCSVFSIVLSTCPLLLPFCSGDYEIIIEIYVVLEEIGGLSPGVMFKGPSLHCSALSHWVLPSLSPISSLSARAEKPPHSLRADNRNIEYSFCWCHCCSCSSFCTSQCF